MWQYFWCGGGKSTHVTIRVTFLCGCLDAIARYPSTFGAYINKNAVVYSPPTHLLIPLPSLHIPISHLVLPATPITYITYMAYPFSTSTSEDSDEPLTPPRSPSRLDFCVEDFDHGSAPSDPDDDLVAGLEEAAHKMDWADTSFSNNRAYKSMYVEEDPDEVDTVPFESSRLPIVESDDDSPEAMESCSNGDPSTSHIFPVPPEAPPHQPVIEPCAPTPVRPPSIQPQIDVQEPTHSSRVSAQRLNYPHHGFSRSALLHQKSFWNSRHEEWAGWQARIEQDRSSNSAYTAIVPVERRAVTSPPPYMRTPPSGLERDVRDHPPRKYEQDVHAPIYPRVGDISALRDPYSVNIDRCFFKFPLWTLHKTLYVFEMHQRSAPLSSSSSAIISPDIPESDSSSTLSSYTSAGSGDDEDSDDTLVAEDQSVSKEDNSLEISSHCPSSPSKDHSWNNFCEWQMSWYARWELLIGLVQRDQSQRQTFGVPRKLESPVEDPVVPPTPPEPIFRFAGEDGDEDSDEEEDYGTLLSNPTFSADFEDGYQRAIAFFGRDSRSSVEDL